MRTDPTAPLAKSVRWGRRLAVAVSLILALSLVIGAPVSAADLTLASSDGAWTNVVGDRGVPSCLRFNNQAASTTDENVVAYGTIDGLLRCPSGTLPVLAEQTGFGFRGVGSTSFAPGEPFLLGQFTHYNRSLFFSSRLTAVDLQIRLSFSNPALNPAPLVYTLLLDETPNTPPCPFPGTTECPDRVQFQGTIPPQQFFIGGITYTLQIAGFVPGTAPTCRFDPANVSNFFITEEFQNNRACLFGRVLVNQPAIQVEKTGPTGPLNLNDAVTYEITVTNIGTLPLGNVQVTDALAPNCDRTVSGIPALALLSPGASVSYTCTQVISTANYADGTAFRNEATAVGTPPNNLPPVSDRDDHIVPIAGSLTVNKVVNWNGLADPAQTFTICISGPTYPSGDCQTIGAQGGALVWDTLLPGDYVVTETDPGSGWVVAGSGVTVAVPAGESASHTVENSLENGRLIVTKNVNWNGVDPDPVQLFTICVSGPTYPNGDCRDLGAEGGTLIWEALRPGDYVVTETGSGPLWAVEGSGATVFVTGASASATITNTYIPQSACPVFEGFPITRSWWPDGDNQDVIRLVSGGPVTYRVEGFFTNPNAPAYPLDGLTGTLNNGDELVLTYPPIMGWGSPNEHGAYEAHVKVHFESACGYIGTDWDRFYHDADQDGIPNDQDCAANDPTRGGPEIPDDNIDQDCDGSDLVTAP